MNRKQLGSLVVAGLGLLLTLTAVNSLRKLSTAERIVGDTKRALSGHHMQHKLGSSMDAELDAAGKKVRYALYGGLILIAAGAGAFFYYRKN